MISTQEKIDDNRKTNKCLHFIKLTREKEFEVFDTALKQNREMEFNETIFTDTGLPKEKISVTVNRLSLKYSIDKSKLSNFLYVFYIFERLNSIE